MQRRKNIAKVKLECLTIQNLEDKGLISSSELILLRYCQASTGHIQTFKNFLALLEFDFLKQFLELEDEEELCQAIIDEMRKRPSIELSTVIEYYKILKGRDCHANIVSWLNDELAKMNIEALCALLREPLSGYPFSLKKTISHCILIKSASSH